MTKRAKPACVRYYVDADLIGLAKSLSREEATLSSRRPRRPSLEGGRIRESCAITDHLDTGSDAPRVAGRHPRDSGASMPTGHPNKRLIPSGDGVSGHPFVIWHRHRSRTIRRLDLIFLRVAGARANGLLPVF
jgi:hypothetical protein